MSWSFSVTGDTEGQAFAKFQEALWKNGAHVPFVMGDQINEAASRLAQASLDAQNARNNKPMPYPTRKITLASSGHFNDEGDGNVSVTLHVLPPAPPSDDQNGM